MKNRILAILTVFVVLFTITVNVSAVKMPPLHEDGSLTLTLTYDGQPLTTGKVNILRVAAVEKISEKQYDFRLHTALGGRILTQEECTDPEIAKELLKQAKTMFADQILTSPISNGAAAFGKLDAGLYLVWQEEKDACEGLYAFQPFMISVPRWDKDHYTMHVVAAPKVPLLPTEPPPPPPSEPPPPPDIPQTGQLNWPVPAMVIIGLTLVIMGIILCVSRKRNSYEK